MSNTKSTKIESASSDTFPVDYDVIDQMVLNFTDIMGNNNKFYSIELQKANDLYRIFTHYGRVGAIGVKESRVIKKENLAEKKGKTLDELLDDTAKKEFTSIIKSKKNKGYVPVEIAASEVGSDKLKASPINNTFSSTIVNSGLNKKVEKLVEQIYEEASQKLSKTIKTPLGALSMEQIDKGYEKIEEIKKVIKYHDNKLLIALTSQYYSLIPQYFPGRIDPASAIIDTIEKTWRQEELLQLMKDVFSVKGVLHSQIRQKYDAIRSIIDCVDHNDSEYDRIEDYVNHTHSPHHNVRLKVNDIFKVDLLSIKGRFNPKGIKTTELFHGSANRNVLGILQRGLLIAPTCANHSGAAFGNGIYFARHSTKSAQYSTKFYSNIRDNGFLFVADVALGNMEIVKRFDFRNNGPSRGYDSVKAIAGADLIHDEFIIYNVNQVELKYLIDFTPKHK